MALKNTLNFYERSSGQAINYDKSGIYFSPNIDASTRQELHGILCLTNPLNTGKYLGLPLLIGRSKCDIFITSGRNCGEDYKIGGEKNFQKPRRRFS